MNEGKPSHSRRSDAAGLEELQTAGAYAKHPGQHTLAGCILELLKLLEADNVSQQAISELLEEWFDDLDYLRSRGR